jgi:hypothetical protein
MCIVTFHMDPYKIVTIDQKKLLSQYITFYSSTFFMMPIWSYHQWFGYPFVTLLVHEWAHYNPWYALKYHSNYCIRKWNSCIEKGFSPFPHHTRRQMNIVITKYNFWILANVIKLIQIWCNVFQWRQRMQR